MQHSKGGRPNKRNADSTKLLHPLIDAVKAVEASKEGGRISVLVVLSLEEVRLREVRRVKRVEEGKSRRGTDLEADSLPLSVVTPETGWEAANEIRRREILAK